MVERQDIDALLISALYGELTPSEETRLAAHLDSHPGDRTALADLTHARGLVRESRLFQVQLEPPQSISALLIKEATRCAPKPEVQEGWFARFVRSFAAHPAMAAAAMLVIVLGVATLASRKGDHFAESTAPASEQDVIQEKGTDNAPVAMNGNAAPSGAMGSGSAALMTTESQPADEGAKGDSFRVALDDGIAKTKDQLALADKKSGEKQQKLESVTVTKPTVDSGSLSKETTVTSKVSRQGIELRAPQPAPKELEEDSRRKGKAAKLEAAPEAKPATKSATKNELAFGESADNDATVDGRVAPESSTSAPAPGATTGGAVGGSGGAANRRQEPSAPPTSPSTTTATPRAAAPARTNAAPPPPPKPAPEPRRDAPAKTVDRNATTRAAGPAEDKAADPQLAWARDQHAALIAQVRAKDCKKAVAIATSISNRAPDYYQQNVETDREIKGCIALINAQRERDAEQRSERARATQKRSVNEPASPKAAPPKPTATDAATK